MCGIAGIAQQDNETTAARLRTMLEAMKHRGPDGAGIAIGREVRTAATLDEVAAAGMKGNVGLGHVRLAIVGGLEGFQPFRSSDGRLVLLHNGEIYNHHELRAGLDGDFKTKTDSEVILRMLETAYDGDLVSAVRHVLEKLDGVYAIAASDGQQLVIARDPLGVRQLYLSQTNGTCVFASEKKALIALGAGQSIERLRPAHLAVVDHDGWKQECFRPLQLREIPHDLTDSDQALAAYREALDQAVYKRIRDRDRVGVIFSGGVDSVVIAQLLRRAGIPFRCYTAGFEGAPDLEAAKSIAEQLGFPFQYRALTAEDVEVLLREIMAVVEDRSLNQVEVAVPIFASVRQASEAGERVLFTGQAADELFGGYSWYPKIVDQEGYDSFVEYSIGDIEHLYKETLEREDKITMAHSIELRVPYLDPEVVRVAMRTDPKLKIKKGGDPLGKRIHRRLAEEIGIPDEFANRIKEAAQHGAGIHGVIRSLAERRGFTPFRAQAVGYKASESIAEVLGSSSRYGHRYGEQELWETEDHVQMYLDWLAWKAGLLTEHERKVLEPMLSENPTPALEV